MWTRNDTLWPSIHCTVASITWSWGGVTAQERLFHYTTGQAIRWARPGDWSVNARGMHACMYVYTGLDCSSAKGSVSPRSTWGETLLHTLQEILLWTKAQMLHGRRRCGRGELATVAFRFTRASFWMFSDPLISKSFSGKAKDNRLTPWNLSLQRPHLPKLDVCKCRAFCF